MVNKGKPHHSFVYTLYYPPICRLWMAFVIRAEAKSWCALYISAPAGAQNSNRSEECIYIVQLMYTTHTLPCLYVGNAEWRR